MSITAMKLALDALEYEARNGNDGAYLLEREALRQAIEQAQEPVAWAVVGDGDWGKWVIGNQFETNDPPNHNYWTNRGYELVPLYTTPQPQRDAWKNAAIRLGEELSSVGPDGYYDMTAGQWLDWAMNQQPRGKNSLSQPQQEKRESVPVCEYCEKERPVIHALQREWVGLTNEELSAIYNQTHWFMESDWNYERAIEQALKEKNT